MPKIFLKQPLWKPSNLRPWAFVSMTPVREQSNLDSTSVLKMCTFFFQVNADRGQTTERALKSA